jgi:serine/threonine protein kinase
VDENMNLIIGDLGNSMPAQGEDGSGYLKQQYGTHGYMPPEALQSKPFYNGVLADLFSLGVILFAMAYGHLPFDLADTEECKMYHTYIHDTVSFFKIHDDMRRLKSGLKYVTEDLKDLIINLMHPRSCKRFTMSQVKNHKWIGSHMSTAGEKRAKEDLTIRIKLRQE